MKSRFHDYSIPDLPVTTNSPAGALTPAILSEPVEVSKPRGETAQFHCKVKHLGKQKYFMAENIFINKKNIVNVRKYFWTENIFQ